MAKNLEENLTEHFGYKHFREGQQRAIESVLSGHDTMVVMPTGTGKSLCYQLPALVLPGLTLVISPLIALMKDQVDFLQSKEIAATFINSSIPSNEQNHRLKLIIEGKIKLLFVAPERFRITGFRKILRDLSISLVAVDEAHCISLWGHDFRPDYLQLHDVIEELGHPVVISLTATATQKVQRDIVERLGLKKVISIITGFNRPNLTFRVFPAFGDAQKHFHLERLLTHQIKCAIIYVGTRRHAEEVTEYINQILGIPAGCYHAGLSETARNDAQIKFMEDRIRIIVATNAFGMGIDKPDVRLVMHYNMPGTIEAYYQEAGRAGRDAKRSGCILLYDPQDRGLHEFFIKNDSPTHADLFGLYNAIRSLTKKTNASVSIPEIQEMIDLNDVQIRVGIRNLHNADGLIYIGEERGRIKLKMLPLDMDKLYRIAQLIARRREHKLLMLEQMIGYAECRTCRRRLLLQHFGDTSKPEAILCCDICDRKTQKPVRQRNKSRVPDCADVGRAILWLVENHYCKLGVRKIAQILAGSTAEAIMQFGHYRSELYGAFSQYTVESIETSIYFLINQQLITRTMESGFLVLTLTDEGRKRLADDQSIISLQSKPKRREQPSYLQSLDLLRQGYHIEEIAHMRKLTVRTVQKHLAEAIEEGLLEVEDIVEQRRIKHIRSAIATAGTRRLSSIKDILPSSFGYDEIQWVVAAHLYEQNRRSSAPD